MPIRSVPQAPTDPTAAEMQQYFQELKVYGEQLEQDSAKQEEEREKMEKEKQAMKKQGLALKSEKDKLDAQQQLLEENQASIDDQLKDLQEKQDSIDDQKTALNEREDSLRNMEVEYTKKDTDMARREAEVEVKTKQLQKKDDHFKSRADKLSKMEADLKVEKAKIETLRKELPDGGAGGGAMEATIILQQKQLLEKCMTHNERTEKLIARQLKLEENREKREKERDEKEEESLATGKGFKPPSFKGVQGERPEAHILRAEDWMEASNPKMKDDQKIKNFRLTLDHHAREWYDKADCKSSWEKLKLGFSRYFSTQGRSIKNLLTRWKDFKFNPQTDDIEEFVRDVQETTAQLKYDNEAVGNMIKTSMPMDMYTSLYDVDDLEKIITKVRDIYARPVNKSQSAAMTSAASVPTATPFSSMTEHYMYLQGAQGDNKQKPFKPYVTPQGRGRGRGRGGRGNRGRGRGRGDSQDNRFQGFGRGQFTFRGNWQPRGNRGRGGQKFDKSPNVKKARVNTKTPNQDKERCYKCNEFGHWAKECPQNQQNNGGNGPA